MCVCVHESPVLLPLWLNNKLLSFSDLRSILCFRVRCCADFVHVNDSKAQAKNKSTQEVKRKRRRETAN